MRVFRVVVGVGSFVAALAVSWSVIAGALTSGDDAAVALGVLGAIVLVAIVAAICYRGFEGWLVVCAVLATAGCTRVDPGYEGIKVDMLASERGSAYPIVTGRVWYNPYTFDVYQFPTFLQRIVWTAASTEGSPNDDSFTFRSKEGYAFNVDVGFGYSFIAGRTPEVFIKYRREPIAITDGPFRDVIRDAYVQVASRMEGLSILGEGMTQLNEDVTALVRDRLGDTVLVEYVNIVGKPRVDERVETAINAVIQATQQANEAQERVRMREAEARQRVAQANGIAESMRIEAQAKADAIRIEAEALRQYGAQVIQMRAIEKWNGTMPLVTGEGAMPFITVPQQANN